MHYTDLIDEAKRLQYKDMRDTKKISKMDDLKRSVYNQGYEIQTPKTHDKYGTHGTMNVVHRKTGEPVQADKDRGAIGGKKQGKAGELGGSVMDSVNDAVRADMRKRGKVNKTPEGKEKRKAEMKANLEKKRKQKTMGMTDIKADQRKKRTFEEFMYFLMLGLTED